MDLRAWREENLAKRQIKSDKKMKIFLDRVVWREKREKTFWKSLWPIWKSGFKKRPTRFSIDRNLRFDRSKQTEAHPKILNQFWLIEKQPRLIEIPEKSQFWKKQPSFCIKSSKHWKIWVKCMSMRCKVFQKHKF